MSAPGGTPPNRGGLKFEGPVASLGIPIQKQAQWTLGNNSAAIWLARCWSMWVRSWLTFRWFRCCFAAHCPLASWEVPAEGVLRFRRHGSPSSAHDPDLITSIIFSNVVLLLLITRNLDVVFMSAYGMIRPIFLLNSIVVI